VRATVASRGPWQLQKPMSVFAPIVLQNTAASFIWADLRIAQRSPLRASYGIIGLHAWQTGYAVQVTAADGGGRQRNLTRRRRF